MQDSITPAIRMRPHHLLCMLTFVGKGYSQEFTANFERVMHLIASGDQTVEIVLGPDDLCAPLLGDPACHCRNASALERDRLAAEALTGLLQQPIDEGSILRLTWNVLDELRRAFRTGTIRKACRGCQWSDFCDEIAAKNFSETVLLCGNPPPQK